MILKLKSNQDIIILDKRFSPGENKITKEEANIMLSDAWAKLLINSGIVEITEVKKSSGKSRIKSNNNR